MKKLTAVLLALVAITTVDGCSNFGVETNPERRIGTFSKPEAMKIEVWADSSQTINPSAITFDESGRLYVAEINRWRNGVDDIRERDFMLWDDLLIQSSEDRLAMFEKHSDKVPMSHYTSHQDQIRLLEDTSGDGRADRSIVYADGFNAPLDGPGIGLLARDGAIYYTNIPHLWQLEDLDNDGKADKRTSLQDGFGIRMSFSGHDMHGLVWGPDGKLYWSLGDRGYSFTTKEGVRYHAPNEGAVFRSDADGSNIEVFYLRLRNPQELAFDDYGNLFTADNDGDGIDKERVNYLVEGGDSGWHAGYQVIQSFASDYKLRSSAYMKQRKILNPWMDENLWSVRVNDQPAYILPGVGQLLGGPSGLVYNPSDSMGEKYDKQFFVIHYQGSPSSSYISSFGMEEEGASFKMVDYKEFFRGSNSVDIEFGPDGKMYMSEYNFGGWLNQDVGNIYTFSFPDELAKRSVKDNEAILASDFSKKSIEQLIGLLSLEHRTVRQRAQFELAKRGPEAEQAFLQAASQVENDVFTRIHSIWGLGMMAHNNPALLDFIIPLLVDDEDQVRIQSARVLGDHRWQLAIPSLVSTLDDTHAKAAMYAGIAIGRMRYTGAVDELISVLRRNEDKDLWLRHGAVMGLAGIEDKNLYLNYATDPSPSVRMGTLLTLRRSKDPRLAMFLEDSDRKIVYEAIIAINDLPVDGAQAQLANMLDDFPPPENKVDELMHHRLINANFYEAKSHSAQRLIRYAMRRDIPQRQRREAVAALQAWDDGHRLDTITGLPRNITKNRANISIVVSENLEQLFDSAHGKLLAQVLQLKKKYPYEFSPDKLAEIANDTSQQAGTRIEALGSLSKRGWPELEGLLEGGLVDDESAEVRAHALTLLMQSNPDEALARALILTQLGSIKDRQKAYAVISGQDTAAVIDRLEQDMHSIINGTAETGLIIEMLYAAKQSANPELVQLVAGYEEQLVGKGRVAQYRGSMEGGDIDNGEDLFFNHGSAQCMRCHKINSRGADVGPDLSVIGLKPSAYILQAIVDPAAVVAPGYGKVSGMPPVTSLMNAEEIRDVVTYLSSLKVRQESPEPMGETH